MAGWWVGGSMVCRLALSLDVEYDFFEPRTDDATAQLVLFKYPPSSSASDGQVGGHRPASQPDTDSLTPSLPPSLTSCEQAGPSSVPARSRSRRWL